MICRKCGNLMSDQARVCNVCGATLEIKQAERQTVLNPQHSNHAPSKVGFLQAIQLFFTHYADFKGRSRRSEYWWFVVFNMIVSNILTLILGDLSWIWTLVILVPSLALCVRRLHDVGKSGWWYLWILLPIAGVIILLIQFCKDSAPDNQWGPNPKCYC